MPRLETIDARCATEQWIAIGLRDIGVREFGLGVIMIVLREVVDRAVGEPGKVAHRHDMAFLWPTAGVLEDAVLEPDRVADLGHLGGKGVFAAGQALGDDDTGIVARDRRT